MLNEEGAVRGKQDLSEFADICVAAVLLVVKIVTGSLSGFLISVLKGYMSLEAVLLKPALIYNIYIKT